MVDINSKYALRDTDSYYEEPLAHKSAMWSDMYALTMSQAFFTQGKHDVNTTFHAYIRKEPFGGSFLLTGGQNIIFEWLSDHWEFDERDIENMRNKVTVDPDTGKEHRVYSDDFIDFVANSKCELTIDAMPEGEIAFRDEPIYRVHGPLWQCLMVEAAILNATNSQSLFSTLAARLKEVTNGEPILEFGLRRAQCIGGLEPTRGAYLGGIDGTSNNLAEKHYGIPTKGTFAHAFVMMYEDEMDAFKEYAEAMPYNGVFLVDTYDTVEGVKRAVQACKEKGIKLAGIRLDSGDLAYLSIEARAILDDAGFTNANIVASNDLEEESIQQIKDEGGKVNVWGVGTNLVTSRAQPALGAVYKLGAVYGSGLTQAEIDATRKLIKQGQSPNDPDFVRNVIKMSQDEVKVTIPGELDLIRYLCPAADGSLRFDGDTILQNNAPDPVAAATGGRDAVGKLERDIVSVPKGNITGQMRFQTGVSAYRPLKRIFNEGVFVSELETIHQARDRAMESLAMLDPSHKRRLNPHIYGVGIEESLYQYRQGRMGSIKQKVRAPHPVAKP